VRVPGKVHDDMINRAAIILRYKAPAVRWINDADPYDDDPGITLARVNEDRTVYLVHSESAENMDDVRAWIELNVEALFESELEGWYTDESLWPKNRDLKLFDQWFDVECHTVLVDTFTGPIVDDEYEL